MLIIFHPFLRQYRVPHSLGKLVKTKQSSARSVVSFTAFGMPCSKHQPIPSHIIFFFHGYLQVGT